MFENVLFPPISVPGSPGASLKLPLTSCSNSLRINAQLPLPLHEALFAVDRSVSAGLEGNFALFSTICTNSLVHLPWSEVSSLSKPLSAMFAAPSIERHSIFSFQNPGQLVFYTGHPTQSFAYVVLIMVSGHL